MHPDLQRYLDGELDREALPATLREEADAWDLLTATARGMHAEAAPPTMVARVLAALPASPRRVPVWKRVLDAALKPREIHVRPIYGLLAAAALAALLIAPLTGGRDDTAPVDTSVVYVRFTFTAPAATSVTLAGDFNDWQSGALPLTDGDGDGVWTGTFALEPGLHKYMFVVDGDEWETDPGAERHIDDGFGMQNALIAITPPVRRSL